MTSHTGGSRSVQVSLHAPSERETGSINQKQEQYPERVGTPIRHPRTKRRWKNNNISQARVEKPEPNGNTGGEINNKHPQFISRYPSHNTLEWTTQISPTTKQAPNAGRKFLDRGGKILANSLRPFPSHNDVRCSGGNVKTNRTASERASPSRY